MIRRVRVDPPLCYLPAFNGPAIPTISAFEIYSTCILWEYVGYDMDMRRDLVRNSGVESYKDGLKDR
jgi:hypothetical protein